MADINPTANVFRVVDGKHFHNNQEVSPDVFKQRKTAADQAIKNFESAPTPGFEDMEADMKGFKERAEARRKATGKKAGGTVKSASSRGDGIAQRGKTKGRIV
jgi:hypothetical protein